MVEISDNTLHDWQKLLDLMAIKYIIPPALIMKVDLPNIKCFYQANLRETHIWKEMQRILLAVVFIANE